MPNIGPPPRFQPGERVGRLTVVEVAPKTRQGRDFRCRCDCGTEVVVHNSNLGHNTWSCGCLYLERVAALGRAKRTHGHWTGGRPSRTYATWTSMKARCYRPQTNGFKNYGGRGITVCDRWHNFENFLADMGERPEGKTLDRVDVNGNYEPGNCRWATRSEQARNRQAA